MGNEELRINIRDQRNTSPIKSAQTGQLVLEVDLCFFLIGFSVLQSLLHLY